MTRGGREAAPGLQALHCNILSSRSRVTDKKGRPCALGLAVISELISMDAELVKHFSVGELKQLLHKKQITFEQFVQYSSVVLKEMRERPLEPAEGPSSTSTSSSRMRSVGEAPDEGAAAAVGEAPAGGERPSK